MINKSNPLIQYTSVVLVTLFYMVLLILAQLSFQATVESLSLKIVIATLVGLLFPVVIYFLNLKYFRWAGLEPPQKLSINKDFFIKLAIGFLIALILLYSIGLLFFLQTNDVKNLLFKVSFSLVVFNILTAIGEEVIFRGTFLNFFAQKNKKYLGLLITSSIFSLIHLLNLLLGQEVSMVMILSLFLAGLLLGLIYLRFGIVSAIATHYLWNLLYGGASFSSESYAGISVLATACLILFLLEKRANSPQALENQIEI